MENKFSERTTRLAIVKTSIGASRLALNLRDWLIPPNVLKAISKLQTRELFPGKNPLHAPPHAPDPLYKLMFPHENELLWPTSSRLVNAMAQSFTAEQHHFVRYLAMGAATLENFYQLHRPSGALEARFVKETRCDYSGPGWLQPPWVHVRADEDTESLRPPELFGPVSAAQLATEKLRLDSLMQSISENGVIDRQAFQPGGAITGQLLFNDEDDDYRIMVINGNHRVAVLAHLGLQHIPIRFRSESPPVRLSDLNRWPGVIDRRFTPETAHAFFHSFFRDPHHPLLESL